jgi:hypothetical protein
LIREKWLVLNDKNNTHLSTDLFYEIISISDFVSKSAKELLKDNKLNDIMEEQKQYTMKAL